MDIEDLRAAIERALAPERFFAGTGILRWEHRTAETIRWEIFRGHLLDARHTRQEAQFETWDVLFQAAPGARGQRIASIRLAEDQRRLYVTRELLVHGEEAYESEPNVISTRPAEICSRELVGTLEVTRCADSDGLSGAVAELVLLALVGTSRLPITSVESPLPAFSLGQVGYASRVSPRDTPARTGTEWIERALVNGLSPADHARVLELALRAAAPVEVPSLAESIKRQAIALELSSADLRKAFVALFNQVALTPYTSLVDNLLAMLRELVTANVMSVRDHVDTLSYYLRHLARHLTAFDLITFHNQGANYPDALILGAAQLEYASLIDQHSELLVPQPGDSADESQAKRIRRRALRQAWIVARQYQGHLVPDVPTSPGEQLRVLPAQLERIPHEQLAQPGGRRRRLFADAADRTLEGATAAAFEQCLKDLEHPAEARELGLAVFLDRPLGVFKQTGEVDRTPLVSYEAFSRQIAVSRLNVLAEGTSAASLDAWQCAIEAAVPNGIAASGVPARGGRGVVELADASRAADDFLFVRTTRNSLAELLRDYDWSELARERPEAHRWLCTATDVLLIRTAAAAEAEQGGVWLTAYDRQMQARIGLIAADLAPHLYAECPGREILEAGFRIRQLDGNPVDLPVPAHANFL